MSNIIDEIGKLPKYEEGKHFEYTAYRDYLQKLSYSQIDSDDKKYISEITSNIMMDMTNQMEDAGNPDVRRTFAYSMIEDMKDIRKTLGIDL